MLATESELEEMEGVQDYPCESDMDGHSDMDQEPAGNTGNTSPANTGPSPNPGLMLGSVAYGGPTLN